MLYQVLQYIDVTPKRLIIGGSILFLLGLSWFSGGPFYQAFAQGTPCPESPSEPTDPGDIVRGVPNPSKASGNANALSFKLKCNFPNRTDPVDVWRILLSATDILVALYLIVIAVATIFHIQYDTYSIKKTLPPLIIGIILANFSLLITRFIVDFANVLTVTFVNAEGGMGNFIDKLIGGMFSGGVNAYGTFLREASTGTQSAVHSVLISVPILAALAGGLGPLLFGVLIIGLVAVLIPALALLFMGVLLFARYYIILALAIVSPLAFITMAFPGTQKYFQRWWQEFLKWTFMMPIMFFLLWLAIRFSELNAGAGASFATYFITLILMYLAIKVPFSWSTLAGFAVGAGIVGAGKTMFQKGSQAYGVAMGNIQENWRLKGRAAGDYADRVRAEANRRREVVRLARRVNAGTATAAEQNRFNQLASEFGVTSAANLLTPGHRERRQVMAGIIRNRHQAAAAGRRRERWQSAERVASYANMPASIEAIKFSREAFKARGTRGGQKSEFYGRLAGPKTVSKNNEEAWSYMLNATNLETAETLAELSRGSLNRTAEGQEILSNPARFRRFIREALSENIDVWLQRYSPAGANPTLHGRLQPVVRRWNYFYNRDRTSIRDPMINRFQSELGPYGSSHTPAAYPHAAVADEDENTPQVFNGVPNNAAVAEQLVQVAKRSTGMPSTIVVNNANVNVRDMAMPAALDMAMRRMFTKQQALMQALQGAQASGNPQEVVDTVINNQIDTNVKNNTPLSVEQIAQQTGVNDPESIRAALQDYDAQRRAAMGVATGLGVERANFEQQYEALSGRLTSQLENGELNLQDLENFRDQAQGILNPPSQS